MQRIMASVPIATGLYNFQPSLVSLGLFVGLSLPLLCGMPLHSHFLRSGAAGNDYPDESSEDEDDRLEGGFYGNPSGSFDEDNRMGGRHAVSSYGPGVRGQGMQVELNCPSLFVSGKKFLRSIVAGECQQWWHELRRRRQRDCSNDAGDEGPEERIEQRRRRLRLLINIAI